MAAPIKADYLDTLLGQMPDPLLLFVARDTTGIAQAAHAPDAHVSVVGQVVSDHDADSNGDGLRLLCARHAGLCARDDVLWPYYSNFKSLVTRPIETKNINGGNFGPDLDPEGILDAFLQLIGEK